jgi:cyclopropane-fatty-acyl-phospholipid synthase
LLNKNTINRSKKNISLHYDLGNNFFQQWLDETMQYSSAHYENKHKNLKDAQYNKFKNINNLLDLSKDDNVLEIGCGWGSLAQYLFNENDISIDAITISEKQLQYAKKLSLKSKSNNCSFKLLDYRHTSGLYDKIVSVEMIEAVGIKYLPVYFETIKNRLKPNGYAIIQAITIGEESFSNYSRNVDFIQKYIFPGGVLPSIKQLEKETMRHGLEIENINILNDSYAKTLQEWRNKFNNNWEIIKKIGYDEKFKRTWNYYLSYCEAGFAERTINVGLYKIKSM